MIEAAELWLKSFSPDDPLAMAAYVLLHVAFAVLFLPCSPLTFMAGLIWGLWPGLPISISAAMLSATATFGLGRWTRQRASTQRLARSRWFARIKGPAAAVTGAGWRSVLLFQATPLVPGSSLGYVFGFTAIGSVEFLLASLAGMLPMQAAVVAAGGLTYDAVLMNEMRGYVSWAMLLVGGAAGILIHRRRLRLSNSHHPQNRG